MNHFFLYGLSNPQQLFEIPCVEMILSQEDFEFEDDAIELVLQDKFLEDMNESIQELSHKSSDKEIRKYLQYKFTKKEPNTQRFFQSKKTYCLKGLDFEIRYPIFFINNVLGSFSDIINYRVLMILWESSCNKIFQFNQGSFHSQYCQDQKGQMHMKERM